MRREVSIHAPLRGATIIGSASESKIVQFQSTHPCGVRRGIRYSTCLLKGFNPRTPAGCDSSVAVAFSAKERFNPRTPAGCDP